MNRTSRKSDLSKLYSRLLGFYPKPWRRQHGAAMLSLLLEDAEHKSLTKLSVGECLSVVAAGIRERFFAYHPLPFASRVLLLAGLAYSGYYSFAIAWAPGAHFPGSVGSFANPSVFTCALLATAWVLAEMKAGISAKRVAIFAFWVNIVVAWCSHVYSWLGPSPWAAIIFAAISSSASWPVTAARVTDAK